MAKIKTAYVCQNCGNREAKWIGQCSACNEWNTFEEEVIEKSSSIVSSSNKKVAAKPQRIKDITFEKEIRINTLNAEFNRVLGGGLVLGSIVLIGGEPGIGKSTLALQIAANLEHYKTMYVSGEESLQQIKLRAKRIASGENNCYILSETRLEAILRNAENLNPDIIVIDSIQTISTEKTDSSPGSVTQIRECTTEILKYAKENNKPVILIGHINKEGNLAGPKVLEHIVDTVLQFEGDRNHLYRIIRATKNRFGSTSELGIFEMSNKGLREVPNPSEMLLSQNAENMSGVAVSATIEGIRPFLIEVQALVSTAAYGTPQRSSTGFNSRRLNMLLAVLEKRARFKLATKDVFLNIAGGLKVDDPGTDLSVVCSVLSSDIDIALPKDVCFAGEIGLSGEIRPVTRVEQRIAEAAKLGFKKIYISKFNKKGINFSKFDIEVFGASKVEEVFRALFK
ncbi:MAG: DNA repair protein RadA [Bacteroidales bacterium]|nr:DNA repair protein RadA [Bacteroidales bacterium]